MRLNSLLRSAPPTFVAMTLVFLPWLAVVLFTAGAWAAFIFLGYAIVSFVVGYGVITLVLPAPARPQTIVLAPAVGILAISALTAFWLRLGLPLFWVPALWLGLTSAGVLGLWSQRALLAKSTLSYAGALTVLSALICLVYFLPAARNDAVLRRDGSFNWIYVDTQYFHSIAAGIKSGASPPREPGTVTAELLYHFGPYAPAPILSRVSGIDLGDALARVTRGASLWALVLSCFGLGTLLSLKATGGKVGGIVSVGGLFFYGSLTSLFTDQNNASNHATGALLFKIPGMDVLADGGPFSHLILGHSVVHGMGAITAIMGLCLIQREREEPVPPWRALVLVVLPALTVAIHSVAALYCLGVVGILIFWGRLGRASSWLPIILMFCLSAGAWTIMGYGHSPNSALVTVNDGLYLQWWTVVVWFVAGLGIRILGFRWISSPLKDPMSALVLATVMGLLLFFLLVKFDQGQQRYGIYFLQSLFSVFAFSRMTPPSWRRFERSKWAMEWLRMARMGMVILITWGILIGTLSYVTKSHTGIDSFHLKMVLSILALILLTVILELMRRSHRLAEVGSVILAGALLVGFLSWITPWLNYGLGRGKMDITLTPGEVRGLKRLGGLSAPGERFATNRHTADKLVFDPERSYAYATLSERPALLEGYHYQGVRTLPWFQSLLRDNDTIFSTTSPETLRQIAKTWRVRWLVARPGTDIALPKPLPHWLAQQQYCGDLKIYRID